MRKQPEIEREELFDRIGYQYHSELQQEMHESDARFRVAACGRRFGKSTWAAHEATLRMFMPETVHWIVGPNYTLGEKEFRIVLDDFKKLGLLKSNAYTSVQNNVNQGNMRIHFKKLNSIIEVKTAEKQDGLVGEGLDSVIMAETAKHRMSTWQMYIEPALSDRRGSADFPSTPQGYNWFKGMYDLGQMSGPGFDDYASWTAPTWMNTKMYPGGYNDPELVRIRNTISKAFWDQEYAALFTSFEGMIYDEFSKDIHVKRIPYEPNNRNYWALDFGFTDPFVCLDIMVDAEDRVYVWREYQVRGKSTSDNGLALANRLNPEGFHVNAIFADPRGADQIATLQALFGGIAANVVGWEAGIEAVKRQLKVRSDGLPGLIIDPSCVHTIRQISQLRKKVIKEGQNERQGQHDFDDHGPDALRYFHNEYFVNGSGRSLSDVYDTPNDTEAAGFFTYTTGITLDDGLSFFRQ